MPRIPARRLCALLTVSLLALIGLTVPAQAATSYTTSVLWDQVGVNGRVGLGVTIKASPSTTVQRLDVCVRSSSGTVLDLPGATNVTVTPSGTAYQDAKVFASGTYTYWGCVTVSGKRRDLAPTKKFTVAAAPSPSPAPSPTAGAVAPLPGQPALTAYGSSTAAVPFAHQGALIIAGRDQYNEQPFKDASAAGATVLLYVDPVIDASYGTYHQLLDTASACGPAVPAWPGNYTANSYGKLNDFRPGGILQAKFKCVLEKAVADNPHLGGFFLDDTGSRSWFPGFSWDTFGAQNQADYRAGAIALTQTAHDVAVEHGLMVMVNGTWAAGSLASSGGGYPDLNSNGNALVDGGYIEHHSTSEVTYFTGYAKGQWATAAGDVAQGKPVMYVQAADEATRAAYAKTGVFAYLSAQQDYSTASVWGSFHATGLPAHVAR